MVRLPFARPLSAGLLLGMLVPPTLAQIDVGSTGAHGVFDAAARDTNNDGIVIVDLATEGNYDAAHWMVVFHFTSVNIQANKTVRFTNHPSRAPVVWLSQSTIDIRGLLDLNGQGVNFVSWAEGGPGGFRGGVGVNTSAGGWVTGSGLGPGGGFHQQSGTSSHGGAGSHSTYGDGPGGEQQYRGALYGNAGIFQLIGGSGGAAGRTTLNSATYGGGGGGGAILLAANNRITVFSNSRIDALGGTAGGYNGLFSGGGAGGAIRMVADEVVLEPNCLIRTNGQGGGYLGGAGRIRIEANVHSLQSSTSPPFSLHPTAVDLDLSPAGAPAVVIQQLDSIAVPSDPRSSFSSGADLDFPISGQKTVLIRTRNVPLTSQVFLRVTRVQGAAYEIQVANPLTLTGGLEMEAETSISVPLENGITALQARVVLGV